MEENEEMVSGSEEKEPLIRGGWLRALLLLLSFILAQFVLQLISIAVILAITPLPITSIQTALTQGYPQVLLIHQAITAVGTLILVWLFRRKVDREDLPSIGLKLRLGPLASGLLLGPLMMGLCVLILHQFDLVGIRWQGLNLYYFGAHLLLTFTIAFKEELLFRGYVLKNLMSSMNPPLALTVSAVAFLLFHIWNPNLTPVGILNLFLAGLLLGVSYVRDQQLAFPIGLHLSWNFAQGPIFGYNVSGLSLNKGALFQSWTSGSDLEKAPSYVTGGDFGLEGSILLAGLQILLIPSLYWIWKKMQ